jgi:hypothetical protein
VTPPPLGLHASQPTAPPRGSPAAAAKVLAQARAVSEERNQPAMETRADKSEPKQAGHAPADSQSEAQETSQTRIISSPARTTTNELKATLSATTSGSNYSTPITSPTAVPRQPGTRPGAISLDTIASALEKVTRVRTSLYCKIPEHPCLRQSQRCARMYLFTLWIGWTIHSLVLHPIGCAGWGPP